MLETIIIRVVGKVQGVYYRQSTLKKANELGIMGTVSNLADGSVEITATGSPADLQQLLRWCAKGPDGAEVAQVKTSPAAVQLFPDFRIVRR